MILRYDFWSGVVTKRRMLRAGNRVLVEQREIPTHGSRCARTVYVLIDGTAWTLIDRDMLAEVGEVIEVTPKADEQMGLF